MQIPENLVFSGSKIEISFAQNSHVNRTANSILLAGSRNGFLSLSNCLIYLVNSLESEIELHELPFVESQIGLTVEIDELVDGVDIERVFKKDSQFIWRMSETQSDSVFTSIHSLGHLNSELHFDNGKYEDEISVYCVVEE